MYYFNKAAGFITSPAGVAAAGFIIAWICSRTKRSRSAKTFATAAVLWLWAWMTPAMTRIAGVPLENMTRCRCTPDYAAVPKTEIAVLLGGGFGVHAACGAVEMSYSSDRARVAANLWKAGRVEKIYLTGPCVSKSTLTVLKEFGVDPSACRFFEDARNTEEEAAAVSKCADGRIVLVTSAWHMPRSRLLFERRGFEVIECPADFEMHYAAEKEFSLREILPDAEAFLRNSNALKEWVALVGYKLFR